MKTKIISLFLTLTIQLITSQTGIIDCVIQDSDIPLANGITYSNNPNDYLTGDQLVINVFYWQVRGPNGNYGGATFTETKVLENIAYLNTFFNQYNIFFKYRGYDGFDTPANIPLEELVYNEIEEKWECIETGQYDPNGYGFIDRCQYSEFLSWVSNNGYYKTDAINIYVPYGSQFGGAGIGKTTILKIGKLTDPVVLHEIAHNFRLRHTRSGNDLTSFYSERATRDSSLPICDFNNPLPNGELCYNADTAADGLVETAAHGVFYDRVCGDGSDPACYPNVDSTTCEVNIFSQEKDYDGQFTRDLITHEDIINIMSTAYLCTETFFFPAQINYMRNAIQTRPHLIEVSAPVSALYEPYRGEYNIPGTVVEYNPAKFQPGFDYEFLKCFPNGDYPLPSDYTDTSFTYWGNGIWVDAYDKDIDPSMYNTIIHKDGTTIRIVQLEQQPRKCWNTGQGSLIGGALVRFNDGVLNANVTITLQDSTAINNPQLIDNLQPGLYNIIKTFENGNSQENVILKENN